MSLATLDEWIRSLESVKGDLKVAGPAIAKEVKEAMDTAVSSGKSVDGTVWAPTKKGTKPLRNAASAISVRAIGSGRPTNGIFDIRKHRFSMEPMSVGILRAAGFSTRV